MKRIVFVWLPAWPIERLQRAEPGAVPPDRPFALVDTGSRGLVVHAANGAALAAGVRIGATLADTRAVLPSLAVRPADVARDAAALAGLALWLGRYGPCRNVAGSDGAWVDTTGVAHLFGSERGLLSDLVGRLAGLGITARAGLADTHRAASALARLATAPGKPSVLAPPGGSGEALAPLHVAGLDLAPDAVDLLRRLGLKRIGDLYGLPRAALAHRFRDAAPRVRGRGGRGGGRAAQGEVLAASVLRRLDQALGIAGDPRRPMAEPPAAEMRLPCPEPLLTSTAIEAALATLAGRLVESLAASGLGARAFRLALYRADGTTAVAAAATSAPCREAAHICRLLGERIAVLDAGFGVDLVALAADRLEPLTPDAPMLAAPRARARPDPERLIDRLASRLGSAAVRRLAAVASHVPERAEARLPALAGAAGSPLEPAAAEVPLPATARPALLVDPPEPADVVAEVPDGAPVRLHWRRIRRRIVRAEGPERIAPEWWRALAVGAAERPRTRDYWRLEDDTGGGYWVYREGLWQDDEATATGSGGAEADDGPAASACVPSRGRDTPGREAWDAEAPNSETSHSEAPGGELRARVPRWFVHGVFA